MAEAADGEWADLLVEREVVEVHLAARLHRQPLRVLDAAVGVDADESAKDGRRGVGGGGGAPTIQGGPCTQGQGFVVWLL